MLQPVKTALGEFLGRFYATIVPTTKSLESYVTRGLGSSIVWAPARMVDAAEDMLALWLRSNVRAADSTEPPPMPVIIVAMSKDYIPTGRDYTRQVADRLPVIIPSDIEERVFGLRTAAGDIRTQLVFFATDEPSARSLAAQFLLFLDPSPNRRFMARYAFAGLVTDWAVQVESPDSPAMSIQTEAKNLTILAIDLNLHAQIPFYDAPASNADGHQGGYPVVQGITTVVRP